MALLEGYMGLAAPCRYPWVMKYEYPHCCHQMMTQTNPRREERASKKGPILGNFQVLQSSPSEGSFQAVGRPVARVTWVRRQLRGGHFVDQEGSPGRA